MIEILAGNLKGRKLSSKSNSEMRATSSKVRQAVFDIMRGVISDAKVIDFFAGSGALGIESISLGARCAVFVESHKPQANVIKRDLIKLGIEGKAKVLNQDALTSLEVLAGQGYKSSLMFLDPPYHYDSWDSMLNSSYLSMMAEDDSWIVAEQSKDEGQLSCPTGFNRIIERIYGDTRISIFGKNAPD